MAVYCKKVKNKTKQKKAELNKNQSGAKVKDLNVLLVFMCFFFFY